MLTYIPSSLRTSWRAATWHRAHPRRGHSPRCRLQLGPDAHVAPSTEGYADAYPYADRYAYTYPCADGYTHASPGYGHARAGNVGAGCHGPQ